MSGADGKEWALDAIDKESTKEYQGKSASNDSESFHVADDTGIELKRIKKSQNGSAVDQSSTWKSVLKKLNLSLGHIRLGWTNKDACDRMNVELAGPLSLLKTKPHKLSVFRVIIDALRDPSSIIGIISLVFLALSSALLPVFQSDWYSNELIAETVFLTIALAFMISAVCIRLLFRGSDTVRAAGLVLAKARVALGYESDWTVPPLAAAPLFRVLRGGKWRSISRYSLVFGDIIELTTGTRIADPFQLAIIDEKHCSSHKFLGTHRFIVCETPIVKELNDIIGGSYGSNPPPLLSVTRREVVRAWSFVFVPICVLVSLMVGIVRAAQLGPGHLAHIINFLVTRQAYLLMSSIPFLLIVLWSTIATWGYSRLQSFALEMTSSDSQKGDEISEDPTESLPLPRFINWSGISRKPRQAVALGSTSILCFLDQAGVLMEPLPSVERILIMEPDMSVIRMNLGIDWTASAETPVDTDIVIRFDDPDWKRCMPNLKPLGLAALLTTNCGHPERAAEVDSGVRHRMSKSFLQRDNRRSISGHEHSEVLESPTASSPPIGSLPTSLNFPKRSDSGSVHLHPARNLGYHDICVCPLGRTIGFDDGALNEYVRVREIHSFVPPAFARRFRKEWWQHVPATHMVTMVVEHGEEEERSFSLFSKGTPDMVLRNCTEYWNGEAVEPLTHVGRERLFRSYEEWGFRSDAECVAFAYAPLDEEWNDLCEDSSEPEFVYVQMDAASTPNMDSMHKSTPAMNQMDESETANTVRRGSMDNQGTEPTTKRKCSKIGKPSIDRSNSVYSNQSDSGAKGDGYDYRRMISKQIFVGMTALYSQPRPGIVSLIDDLRASGIRFALMTEGSERRALAVGQRLGLETDWNCCISLRHPKRDTDTLEPEYRQNVSRMPRGIAQIRPHIANVDNVPLLVELFSESTPETASEMVKIWQENGEVVTVIASPLGRLGPLVMSQADAVLAVTPAFPSRCKVSPPYAARLVSDTVNTGDIELEKKYGADMEKINTLKGALSPMWLLLPWDAINRKDLSAILASSRQFLSGMRGVLRFYLMCHVVLVLTLTLVGAFVAAPIILTGYQILWLQFIMFPLLSIPHAFLAKDGDGDILHRFHAKRALNEKRKVCSNVFSWRFELVNLFIRALVVTLGVFFVFIGTLNSFWNGGNVFLGVRAYGVDYDSAITHIQFIVVFSIVLYLTVLSAACALRGQLSRKKWRSRSNLLIIFILIGTMVIQLVFSVVGWNFSSHMRSITTIAPFVWIPVLAFTVVIVLFDWWVHRKEDRWDKRNQKQLRLMFNTKLGMHSPVPATPMPVHY